MAHLITLNYLIVAVRCHGRSCFEVLPEMTFDEASLQCSDMNGRLAEPRDSSTNGFLKSWATGD